MSLPDVETARARMLARISPLPGEDVELAQAVGRVLAEPVPASRDQPPYRSSAMDGWAIRREDALHAGAALRIVGESAAGRPYQRPLGADQGVRIFTGAALPDGADWIVPQETAEQDGEVVKLGPQAGAGDFVRPRGGDFRKGDALLDRGVRLDPWRLVLAASAGVGRVRVSRRPAVAVLSTGEELAAPGDPAGDFQIFDAAGPAVAALSETWGGSVDRVLRVPDEEQAIVETSGQLDADLIVTIGGASVGDYDLVKPALRRLGLELDVEGVNVRPGKPTWFGRLGPERGDRTLVLGLPGNPASALVCAELFLKPLLLAMQGAAWRPKPLTARLTHALLANGAREHFMRARLHPSDDGVLAVSAFPDQDSSLVTVLAEADALLRRPANAQAAAAGDLVEAFLLARL